MIPTAATRAHMAVVPVRAVDDRTRSALDFARTIAPRVLAIHIRDLSASGMDLEARWPHEAPEMDAEWSQMPAPAPASGWPHDDDAEDPSPAVEIEPEPPSAWPPPPSDDPAAPDH